MRSDVVGLGKQTAAGTKNTTAEYFPPVETTEPAHSREIIEQEETTGVAYPAGIDYGVEFWTIGIKGAARVASFPRLLSMFYGQPTTSTPDATNAPTARQHLFPMNAPKEHSVYVARKDPTPPITDLFWDVIGDELTMSIVTNGFLMFDGKAVARMLDDTQSAPVATYDASARMAFDQIKVYISVDGGAEAEVKCRNYSCTTKNSVQTDDDVLGQRTLQKLYEGNRNADVKFTVAEALSTHYRRALQSDPAKVKLRMEALGATIGGAVKFKVEQTVYACEYLEAPANVNAGERLKSIEISARARYDETVSKFIETAVVNTVASY